MNESLYTQGVWKRIGKIGDSGQKILNTGWLDSAFGGEEARKKIMLDRIGAIRDEHKMKTKISNIGADADRLESRDALAGDIITGLSLPLSYKIGRDSARDIDAETARVKQRNLNYRGLLGGS